jgi:murein DD-endopeptidase MepM/ murein hydrolase activator NlpD
MRAIARMLLTCLISAVVIASCAKDSIGPPGSSSESPVGQLSLNWFHRCHVDDIGNVECSGMDNFGQLGDGGDTSKRGIVRAISRLRFAQVATGAFHTCALAGTRAYCWGNNFFGQLGDGSKNERRTPVPVAGDLEFASLTAGAFFSCGLTPQGVGYCWGFNGSGAIGDGSNTDRVAPARVASDIRFKAISAGADHACALAIDGYAYCWGANDVGQLGASHRRASSRPIAVGDNLTFRSITAGSGITCGVAEGGARYCWGTGYPAPFSRRKTSKRPPDTKGLSITNGVAPSIAFPSTSAAQIPVPSQPYQWPVKPEDRARTGQDYAQYDYGSPQKYHTGIDIGADRGSAVFPMTSGMVIKIQQNDPNTYCNQETPGSCWDHGFGNTVIVQNGPALYTQYSHLESIPQSLINSCQIISDGSLPELHPLPSRWACSIGVTPSMQIGTVGASCYGVDPCSLSGGGYNPVHLHFEVKNFGYLGLSLGKATDDCAECGYTIKHPDSASIGFYYYDPALFLDRVVGPASVQLKVTAAGSQETGRIGPEELYRDFTELPQGAELTGHWFDPVASANCSDGWWDFRQSDGSYMADNSKGGKIPDAWACAGNQDEQWLLPETYMPDLTVRAQVDAQYGSGELGVHVPVTVVRKQGPLKNGVYATAGLYLSRDGQLDSSAALLWHSNDGPTPDFPITALNDYGYRTVTATIDLPPKGGWYYLIVAVDYPINYYQESNEVNNVSLVPIAVECRGDVNDDLTVNVIDLGILLANWNKTGLLSADVNGDGVVNVIDLGIVLSDWNCSTSGTSA